MNKMFRQIIKSIWKDYKDDSNTKYKFVIYF